MKNYKFNKFRLIGLMIFISINLSVSQSVCPETGWSFEWTAPHGAYMFFSESFNGEELEAGIVEIPLGCIDENCDVLGAFGNCGTITCIGWDYIQDGPMSGIPITLNYSATGFCPVDAFPGTHHIPMFKMYLHTNGEIINAYPVCSTDNPETCNDLTDLIYDLSNGDYLIADSLIGTEFDIGDLNQDGAVDIFDIVTIVLVMLEEIEPTYYLLWAGDLNHLGTLTVSDIVMLVNIILE